MAPWADEEYANARAQVFVAALELHKALIAAQAEVFEANLAALMELISAGPGSGASPVPASTLPAGSDPDGARHADVLLAAWRSFFLVVPVVRVPFEAAGSLFGGLQPGALGWLLAAADGVPGAARFFERAVFAGDSVQAEDSRYGTWLPAGPPADTGPRWVGMPLRVVRGQDRGTVDRRNDLDYDGLLIAGRD